MAVVRLAVARLAVVALAVERDAVFVEREPLREDAVELLRVLRFVPDEAFDDVAVARSFSSSFRASRLAFATLVRSADSLAVASL